METIVKKIVDPLLAVLAKITGRDSLVQKPDEAFIRPPGCRLLANPAVRASCEAMKHHEFAWLSEAAYCRGGDQDAVDALTKEGWTRWSGLKTIQRPRFWRKPNVLHVQVWEKKSPPCVAVAFRGTIARSFYDWEANLRWILRFPYDEYKMTAADFCPYFCEEFTNRANTQDGQHLQSAILYATGHSLGGGLAQYFAYALPRSKVVPRVAQIYAFDPSPVTGFRSVAPDLREENTQKLKIDRIYQRGEVLAALRSVTNSIKPPSADSPKIRTVRYNLFYSLNYINNHSMHELAVMLSRLAGR
jgi:Protein of unknown function (DUF2974)